MISLFDSKLQSHVNRVGILRPMTESRPDITKIILIKEIIQVLRIASNDTYNSQSHWVIQLFSILVNPLSAAKTFEIGYLIALLIFNATEKDIF